MMTNLTTGRKVFFALLIFVVLFVSIVFIRGILKKQDDPNHTFIKPRMELSYFEIKSMTKDTVDMNMNILISNPLPVGIHLNDLDFTIYIAGVEVMKSKYGERFDLDANDSSLITFPVIVENKKLTEVLKKLEAQKLDSTDYRITGTTKVNFISSKERAVDFEITRRGPVIYIPKMVVQKFDIEKFRIKKTQAEVALEIENPNIFPFNFKNTQFEFAIDGDNFVKGDLKDPVNIPAKGKTNVTLLAEINLKEALGATWDGLFKASKTNYSLAFSTVLQSSDKAINNSKVIMVSEGNLKELKEMR